MRLLLFNLGFEFSVLNFFKMDGKHMEKKIVEEELSKLLEVTLRLEDELNSIVNE